MDAVGLAAGGYGGTYKLVGGEACLDLINTVSWPGTDREHDWLDRARNVTTWARALGLVDGATRRRLDERASADPETVLEQLTAIRRTRRLIRDAVAPLAHGSWPSAVAVEAVNRLIAGTCARRRIDPLTLEWVWEEAERLPDLMAPVVWSASHVLTELDPVRIKHCSSCGWIFHDTSRNRRRRWCDMADCGSRDKSLRYYYRSKAGVAGRGGRGGR